MAIPFAFPNDEDIENNYQRLDQLLADLFDVLQQILVTQRHIRESQPTNAARNRTGQSSSGRRMNDGPEASPPVAASVPPRLNIPEGSEAVDLPGSSGTSSGAGATTSERTDILTADIPNTQVRSSGRRRRRRRRTVSETSCCEETKRGNTTSSAGTSEAAATSQDWTQVGVNLRKIADDFYASVGKDGSVESEESKRPCSVSSASGDAGLLSMLTPPPFGGSIWTAVIFLVGWRLLRAR